MEEQIKGKESDSFKSSIFEAKHFRWLVFSSFLFVLVIILFLIIFPGYLDFEIVRFLALIIISLYLSLMFFIIWPHNATLDKIPHLNLTIKVAGPIVLWLLIFLITNKLMPSDNIQEKVFTINKSNESFRVPYHETTLKSDETVLDYMMIEDVIYKSHLKAIYVKFPKGKTSVKAQLQFTKYKPINVILDRKMTSIFVNKLEKYD
ncbi:MAG: hypothetical protein JNK20_13610 [Flavipsychrobacter sp.]|nr:hypothetical protein [Flavipsychrobacter sp.]